MTIIVILKKKSIMILITIIILYRVLITRQFHVADVLRRSNLYTKILTQTCT